MDQATEAVDAYAEHVKRLREKAEEEEKTRPKAVVCNISFQQDEAEGLLYLIEDNIAKYGVKSQGLLTRAATKLRDSLFIE